VSYDYESVHTMRCKFEEEENTMQVVGRASERQGRHFWLRTMISHNHDAISKTNH
jgi:hypothetical protein